MTERGLKAIEGARRRILVPLSYRAIVAFDSVTFSVMKLPTPKLVRLKAKLAIAAVWLINNRTSRIFWAQNVKIGISTEINYH
ncbi:MAG: hypothetical protein GYA55_03150 [SAR324 cluster bacterium]|uniref:Uncharacterized protein n=1 Tax=SAR324 cluster bacterium TaxID=2024889 RepID=A0A7X9IIK7_9DELT|nr:hypothetical protein [SAR324 cluster bacterium]